MIVLPIGTTIFNIKKVAPNGTTIKKVAPNGTTFFTKN